MTLAELKSLAIQQQAMFLLARLAKSFAKEERFHKGNCSLSNSHTPNPYGLAAGFPSNETPLVIKHLLGAPWHELEKRYYIWNETGDGWYVITDEGRAALEKGIDMHVPSRLITDALALLHKDLQGYANYFRDKKEKEAVAAAFRRVENRLNEIRDSSGVSSGVSGVALPQKLFESGELKFPYPKLAANNDTARNAYQQHVRNFLSAGIGFFRNAFDHEPHNLPEFDETETIEHLCIASYMLRLIDRSASAPAVERGTTKDQTKVAAKPAPEAKKKAHLQFPKAGAKDGPARFRPPKRPLGKQWSTIPFLKTPEQNVFLSSGPAIWLRLFPTSDSGKRWASSELKEQALSGGSLNLAPFIFSESPFFIRAEDGIGMCSFFMPSESTTNSVAFAFETGEVWSVDTELMTYFPGGILIDEIEKVCTDGLLKYGRYIMSLGLDPPFHWIAGISGTKGRYLRMTAPRTAGATYQGPECLAEDIIVEGNYDGKQSPADALAPFFNEIYHKCGMRRPQKLSA